LELIIVVMLVSAGCMSWLAIDGIASASIVRRLPRLIDRLDCLYCKLWQDGSIDTGYDWYLVGPGFGIRARGLSMYIILSRVYAVDFVKYCQKMEGSYDRQSFRDRIRRYLVEER